MSYIWKGKPTAEASPPDGNRKPWQKPEIIRLRPGSPELERARRVLLGGHED